MNKILEEDALQIIKENKELKDLKNTNFMITGASGMVGIYFVNTLLVLNDKYGYDINLYLVVRNKKKLPEYVLNNKNVHYAIAGQGNQKENLLDQAEELGVEHQFHLLGFRTDALKLYKAADIFVFPSFREGLSVSMMEAMASGLPIVCSKIRGNVDLVEHERGGGLFVPADYQTLYLQLKNLIENKSLCEKFGDYNKKNVEKFGHANILRTMMEIYK